MAPDDSFCALATWLLYSLLLTTCRLPLTNCISTYNLPLSTAAAGAAAGSFSYLVRLSDSPKERCASRTLRREYDEAVLVAGWWLVAGRWLAGSW